MKVKVSALILDRSVESRSSRATNQPGFLNPVIQHLFVLMNIIRPRGGPTAGVVTRGPPPSQDSTLPGRKRLPGSIEISVLRGPGLSYSTVSHISPTMKNLRPGSSVWKFKKQKPQSSGRKILESRRAGGLGIFRELCESQHFISTSRRVSAAAET